MRVLGFEPRTSALSELRSSQLSYTRDVQLNPFIVNPPIHPDCKQKSQPIRLAPRDDECLEELSVWGNNPANGHRFFRWGRG